jgi:hydroxymethylpyrimidine/phosphomethylpyrimidine kinase
VLAFAASDPTGGAGLQADVLTIAAMGCHALSVMTGYTVQDTRGVHALEALSAEAVERQARCLLDDMPVAAFKLGVLASAANARAVARILTSHPKIPVVLDPVLASGRGDALADDELVDALLDCVIPLATLVKPNVPEARRLGGPQALIERGCRYVLLTGTHAEDADVVNTLYGAGGVLRQDRWPRLPGSHHGSGCTLSSAVAAALARGARVAEAAAEAQAFTWQALSRGFRPGRGQFIPDRMAASNAAEDVK